MLLLLWHTYTYIIKNETHSSCEIEDFVETHLCKLCVILRSLVLRVVCPHYTYIITIKIHSSCEIEDFVETHLCKVCVILQSRVLLGVCPH